MCVCTCSVEGQIILILPFSTVTTGFWGGYFGLFLSFHIHAGLLYCDSTGLNGALNYCSVCRGEVFVLPELSSLPLLSSFPANELLVFIHSSILLLV